MYAWIMRHFYISEKECLAGSLKHYQVISSRITFAVFGAIYDGKINWWHRNRSIAIERQDWCGTSDIVLFLSKVVCVAWKFTKKEFHRRWILRNFFKRLLCTTLGSGCSVSFLPLFKKNIKQIFSGRHFSHSANE